MGKDVESVEKTLGRAEIREIKSGKEGVVFVSGSIGTGERGQEANWAVPDLCDTQVGFVLIRAACWC